MPKKKRRPDTAWFNVAVMPKACGARRDLAPNEMKLKGADFFECRPIRRAADIKRERLDPVHVGGEPFPQRNAIHLRATYWRWSETILDICPDLASLPSVLAVGDVHLENFGTWRDAEGRLVFGVNDFDEAAEMPFALDLVRLATSALLADGGSNANDICSALLDGYNSGLDSPRPIVLDADWRWLHDLVAVSERQREKFWTKLDQNRAEQAPARFISALRQAMPEQHTKFQTARRIAGAGSLGRPRWMALAQWRGGPAVREAKALLPSAWTRARGNAAAQTHCGDIADGKYHSPDPWYQVVDKIIVRRLSPNNRKIEAGKRAKFLHERRLHEVMGHDIASLHLGRRNMRGAIKSALSRQDKDWLSVAAKRAASAVIAEFKQWAPAN